MKYNTRKKCSLLLIQNEGKEQKASALLWLNEMECIFGVCGINTKISQVKHTLICRECFYGKTWFKWNDEIDHRIFSDFRSSYPKVKKNWKWMSVLQHLTVSRPKPQAVFRLIIWSSAWNIRCHFELARSQLFFHFGESSRLNGSIPFRFCFCSASKCMFFCV